LTKIAGLSKLDSGFDEIVKNKELKFDFDHESSEDEDDDEFNL
jgi:hypothetical protein